MELEKQLKDTQEMIWKAATLNGDNPLGHHILDANFAGIKDLIEQQKRKAKLEMLEEFTPIAESGMPGMAKLWVKVKSTLLSEGESV